MRATQYKVLNVPNYDWERTVKGSPHRFGAGTRKYMGYESSGYVPTTIALVGPQIKATDKLEEIRDKGVHILSPVKDAAIVEAINMKKGEKVAPKRKVYKLTAKEKRNYDDLGVDLQTAAEAKQKWLDEARENEPEIVQKRKEKVAKADISRVKRQEQKVRGAEKRDTKFWSDLYGMKPAEYREQNRLITKFGTVEGMEKALEARKKNAAETKILARKLGNLVKKIDNVDSYWATKEEQATSFSDKIRVLVAVNSKFLLVEVLPAGETPGKEAHDKIMKKKGIYKRKIIYLNDADQEEKVMKMLDKFAKDNELARKSFLPKNMRM